MTDRCNSCPAEIIWLVSEATGKRAPIDARPVEHGNILPDLKTGTYRILPIAPAAEREQHASRLHTSHFATCPEGPAKGLHGRGAAVAEPMTPERLADIRARAENATPGPWGWPHTNALAGNFADGFDSEWTLIAAIHDAGPVSPADAAFVAASRTDIPDLLARVGELERDLWRQIAARNHLARTASVAGDLWNELERLGHDAQSGCGERGCTACWWAGEYERVNAEVVARLRELFPAAAGPPAATGGEQHG